ncbi:MAG: hypothetical protein M0Q19_05200 [Candidatus Cloacimonetes bacterium]|nr:hypothetical protein [Candidatus Cloacimonadota bacterium]MDD4672995.1 hypothetical protein [Bacteroidales bacterium]MDY0348492.1 hypothetical protein [Tenuifilaceae bacterium]
MKLNEGEVYPFQVLKKLTMPEEGDFLQLRHSSSGRRILLSAEHYDKYGIEPGTTIQCKVDRVNCTGKVFLEPLHPLYTEGNTYSFDIIEVDNNEEQPGMMLVKVKDLFDNTIEVTCPEKVLTTSNKIALKVESIRKGIPTLTCGFN